MTDSPDLETLRAQAADGTPPTLHSLAMALVRRGELDEAHALLGRAAAAGHVRSAVEIARMQLYGALGEPAPAQAVAGFLRAEQAGDAVAGYYLALVALGGVLLPRDPVAIGERLRAAARAGHAPALRAMAMLLAPQGEAGHGQSRLLLQEAARAGDGIAARLLLERARHGEDALAPAAHAALRTLAEGATGAAFPAIAGTGRAREGGTAAVGLDLAAALRAPPLQLRAESPRIATFEGLLSAEECRYVVALGTAHLQPARVLDPVTGESRLDPIRTSHDVRFAPVLEDFALRLLQWRMASAIGLDFTRAEALILLRYQPGQEYRPHRDYLSAASLARDRPEAGQRMATLCCYLADVEAGGGTAFPEAGLVIEARAGRAVAFGNLDQAGRPDPRSLHAGLPVERGEKWLATLWLRQRRYRDF